MKTAIISILCSIATIVQVQAQHLVQNLSVSLLGYSPQTGKAFVITTRDVIRHFVGTNAPGAVLQLVTPTGNPPGSAGNLNASLRVSKGGTTLVEVTSPDRFNLFQDAAALTQYGTITISRAINRFSIDYGELHAELQGFSTWTINTRPVGGNDLSGSGSFVSSVTGVATVDGVTQMAPVRGTVVAGAPRFEP